MNKSEKIASTKYRLQKLEDKLNVRLTKTDMAIKEAKIVGRKLSALTKVK